MTREQLINPSIVPTIIEKIIIELLGRNANNLGDDAKLSMFFEITNKEVLKQVDFSPIIKSTVD